MSEIKITQDGGEQFLSINSTEGLVAKGGKFVIDGKSLEIVKEDDNTIQLIQNFYETRRG